VTDILRNLTIELVSSAALHAYAGNARTHSKRQVALIADSMKAFGWTFPILVDEQNTIVVGEGRFEAAKLLKLKRVPIIRIEGLSQAQIRAYRLADNKLAERAGWDEEILKVELTALSELDLDFDITTTGYEMAEIDLVIGNATEKDAADETEEPDPEAPLVSSRGDLWTLGKHRLLCGDALSAEDHQLLLDGEKVELVIADPPYNLKIAGNVSGLGRKKHGEFAMASGEMSQSEFNGFLERSFGQIAASSQTGALAYIFMDWRHLGETLAAGAGCFTELKNICVWDKGNGGMGSLYRSAHELVVVYKTRKGRHINNVALGSYGRNRTNIWRYAGINSFGAGRDDALAMHPTVKPVAMIADAILDASNRKGLVFDPFAGSGTMLVAAQRTGRRARAMELDPRYVDIALRRYRRVFGVEPVHAATGRTFAECEAEALEISSAAADREGAER
jgi:DNA modification methylase